MRVVTLAFVLMLAAIPVFAQGTSDQSATAGATVTPTPDQGTQASAEASVGATTQPVTASPCPPGMVPAPSTSTSTVTPSASASASTSTAPMTGTATVTMAAASTPEVESFNRQFVRQYYGISDSQVTALENQGMSWGDIYFTANLAARTGQPVSQIAMLRSQGMTWSDIATRYNVAMSDLSAPYIPGRRVAGVATQVMGMPPAPILGPTGYAVLTSSEAESLRAQGYDWQSIAIAANIAAKTGVSVNDVLMNLDKGWTWAMIATSYGLDPDDAMDVSSYPFRRDEGLTEYRARYGMTSSTTVTSTTVAPNY